MLGLLARATQLFLVPGKPGERFETDGIETGAGVFFFGLVIASPEVPPPFLFLPFSGPFFSTSQAKTIFSCRGPNSSLDR